jgi:hypothetical protein
VKGLKVGEGVPYRRTLRVWNIDAGDNNKYLAVSFDRFGKAMQPEGEVSITLPDELKSYRRRDRRGRQSDTCSGIQWNHEAGYRFNTGCCSDGK